LMFLGIFLYFFVLFAKSELLGISQQKTEKSRKNIFFKNEIAS